VQTVHKTLSQKTLHKKIGLVEWLKVKALSSSPSTARKKKKNTTLLKRPMTAHSSVTKEIAYI
jgi:hypothetical protein